MLKMFDFSSSLFWYKLVFMLQLLIAEMILVYPLKKKDRFLLRLTLCSVGCFAFAFLFPILYYSAWYTSVMFFLLFVITLVSLCICFDEKFINLLFCAIVAYTSQHIAHELYELISLVAEFNTINIYLPESGGIADVGEFIYVLIAIYLSVYMVVYWIISFVVGRLISGKSELILKNYHILIWAVIVLVLDIVFSALVTYEQAVGASKIIVTLFTCSNIMSCTLAIAYQLMMIDRDKILKDYEMIQKIWERDKERYKISKESWDFVAMKCHDLKNQLDALNNMNGMVDEEVISELKTNLNLYGSGVKTGNHALDIILFEKNIICQKNNIKLNCMVDASKLSFMSSSNLYSLFGNALQNAIEASMKIEDCDKRLICLNIKNINNMISVHMENNMEKDQELTIIKGFPLTTKTDKTNHGYGMRSIQMIVEKFGGAINFYVQNGWFNLDIIFPIKDAQKS